MSLSSSSHAVAPTAASNSSQSARCAGVTAELATSALIPWPIAAGVFGIARTTAAPAPNPPRAEPASYRRRSTGTTEPRAPGARSARAAASWFGFTAITTTSRYGARLRRADSLARRDAERRRCGARAGSRVDDSNRGRVAAAREPAARERLAHVPEPDQQHSRVPRQRRLPLPACRDHTCAVVRARRMAFR